MINYSVKYSSHPLDFKGYDTNRLRSEFLVEKIFEQNKINLTYSNYDRFIIGGAQPVDITLELQPIDPMKARYFCERRELGIINIGGKGTVDLDGKLFNLDKKCALYVGKGVEKINFNSDLPDNPALFYLNSVPAHHSYPSKLITPDEIKILELGSHFQANKRRILQYIVASTVETCQLQMGLTELKEGNIWNTMPPHNHDRRMEVYFYAGLEEGNSICHFMGEKNETRHLWLQNNQAVISPNWSIHSAAGTSSYFFIWGMAGENMEFSDMDAIKITELR